MLKRIRFYLFTSLAALILLAACDGNEPPQAPTNSSDQTTLLPTLTASSQLSYVHVRSDGNRIATGRSSLPNATHTDIPLFGEPHWVLGVPIEGGSVWVVVLTDGQVQGFQLIDGVITTLPVSPARVDPEGAPLLHADNGVYQLVVPPSAASYFSHPVYFGGNQFAWIDADARLQFGSATTEAASLADVAPLADGRLLTDPAGRLLLLSNPTDRLRHGVLGDAVEPSQIQLLSASVPPTIETTINIELPYTIEGIAPIWADLDGDGTREIIVTRSTSDDGAQLAVYSESGLLLATSEPIGLGNRWRNQLAVGPFGPAGELELVDVRTPHIGGTVEFFQWEGDKLILVAGLGRYTSHQIGSRNLDLAIGGDFDGDGRLEVLVPNSERTELAGLRRTDDGVEEVWVIPAGGSNIFVTNIGTVTHADGRMGVAVGLSNDTLRIWDP